MTQREVDADLSDRVSCAQGEDLPLFAIRYVGAQADVKTHLAPGSLK